MHCSCRLLIQIDSKAIWRISAADLLYHGHQLLKAVDGDESLCERKEHIEVIRQEGREALWAQVFGSCFLLIKEKL